MGATDVPKREYEMRHARKPFNTFVTDPVSGRRYPIPAGGSDDDNGGNTNDGGNDDGGNTNDGGKSDGQGNDDGGTPNDDAKLEEWKAHARKWEVRAKANSDAADELQKIKDANKSDLDKAKDEATQTAKERDDSRAETARLRAALDHGLSKEDLELLEDVPADQVEARAAKLAERIGNGMPPASPGQGTGGGQPKASLESGRDLFDQMKGNKQKTA